MIDVENKVFNKVYNKIIEKYPNALISSEYLRAESVFPAITVMEQSNTVHQQASELSKIENMVSIMYEINVYSNKTVGKKSECKDIIKIADDEMLSMGFIRTYLEPIANLENATIYRIVARYEKLENGDM